MTNTTIGDEVTRLGQLVKTQATWIPALRQDNPTSYVKQIKDVEDFWGYQTCTEFAFYQTWWA